MTVHTIESVTLAGERPVVAVLVEVANTRGAFDERFDSEIRVEATDGASTGPLSPSDCAELRCPRMLAEGLLSDSAWDYDFSLDRGDSVVGYPYYDESPDYPATRMLLYENSAYGDPDAVYQRPVDP